MMDEIYIHVLGGDFESFQGDCIDIGAQLSFFGLSQAKAYFNYVRNRFEMKKPQFKKSFTFGGYKEKRIGRIDVLIPISSGDYLASEADVVNVNIPLLMGLDILDRCKLVIDVCKNELLCPERGRSLPLTRNLGHIYIEWGTEVLYTTGELQRIHRHLIHAPADRLFSLMKRADDPCATRETRKRLEEVTSTCGIFQRIARGPGRFRVALPRYCIEQDGSDGHHESRR